MADLSERISDEIESLKRARDELRVQVHLGAAEAKERFDELERKWHHLEARLRALREGSREPMEDISEAARNLAHEIGEGYRHIKRVLRSS